MIEASGFDEGFGVVMKNHFQPTTALVSGIRRPDDKVPLIGSVAGEIAFARRHPRPAVISGVGSVVGTLAGMAIKLAIGAVMIVWFFLDVFLVG